MCLVPPGSTTNEAMEAATTPLILCGHRHRQAYVEHAGRRAVNPGSVGVSLQSGGKAEYLLLEGIDGSCVWPHIPEKYWEAACQEAGV